MSFKIGGQQFKDAEDFEKQGGFVVSLDVENPEVLDDFLRVAEKYPEEYEKLFRLLSLEVHKYLIRITPMSTGRLRAGWTSFLDAQRADYARQLVDMSLVDTAPNKEHKLDPKAVREGKSYSFFAYPNPLSITLINSVPYGFYVEEGTSKMQGKHFVATTRFKAEAFMTEKIIEWVNRINRTGKLVDPEKIIEEIQN